MATAAQTLTVTTGAAVKLNAVAETDDPTNAYNPTPILDKLSGSSLVAVTAVPLLFGGPSVTNTTNGALLPAGTWTFDQKGNDDIWVIVPSGGSTTTVPILQLSV